MSALPLPIPPAPPPPAPRGAQWLDTKTAAARMGVSARRIAQLCATRWNVNNLARRIDGKWEVRDDADTMLARVRRAEDIPFDQSALSAQHRKLLAQRKRILDGWLAARGVGFRNGQTDERITTAYVASLAADGVSVSAGTLRKWFAAYRVQGLAGLVDGRWMRGGADAADPFLDEVKRLYLAPGKKIKLTVCHLIASMKAEQEGWAVRGYGACKRMVQSIPRGVKLRQRDGVEAFTNGAEPFIERDYTTLASNQCWVGDHHRLDVLVMIGRDKDGKPRLYRPWLTAWLDARSRVIVGWTIVAHDPNSDTILESFARGVTAYGLPEEVYTDHGKDYSAQALGGKVRDDERMAGVFGGLGVGKAQAIPYHPQSKPIERFFRTVIDRFCALWPTYCGSNPQDKPEALPAQLAAAKAPTLAEFIAAFTKWLESDYHRRAHFGDGMEGQTPAAVFAQCLDVKRTADPRSLAVLCLRPSRPVKVTRNGVRFDGLMYFDLDLVAKHLGKEVQLRVNDRDRTSVMVFDAADRFICIAPAARRLPFKADSQAVREAHQSKRQLRRKTREYIEEVRPRSGDDLVGLMLTASAEKARQQREAAPDDPEAGTMVIRPVRSSVDADLAAIDRAKLRMTHKQAVGAETPTMTLEELGAMARSHGRQGAAKESPALDLTELAARLRGET